MPVMQSVNFYQSSKNNAKKGLTIYSIGWAYVATVVVMVAFQAFSWFDTRQTQHELQAVKAEKQKVLAVLDALVEQYPLQKQKQALLKEITDLEGEIAFKTEFLGGLSGQAPAAITGFSGVLKGLARQTVDGLWIEEVKLRQAGEHVKIKGRVLAPDKVLQLVQKLSDEQSFNGLAFNHFSLVEPEETGAPYQFVLSTREFEEEKEDEENETRDRE